MSRRLKWKFWAKTPQNIYNEIHLNSAFKDPAVVAEERRIAEQLNGATMQALGNKIAWAIAEAAEDNRDPMARRDDRYRTLLLKEIAMQLAVRNNNYHAARERLETVETMIYSQPLPKWDWSNQ